jgi:dipicolinate synthase subunit A
VEDLAWVRAYSYQALNTKELDGALGNYKVVFNTIPSLVLNEVLLQQLHNDCLCVELASVQGIDLAAADRMKIPNVWARSLPGKLAPLTAAAAIRDTVYYIISNK